MILSYGVSLPGTYHIKNDIVCQDSFKVIEINKFSAIAAVADGLGSALYSDIGSGIAVTTAVEHCKQNIRDFKSENHILEVIKSSFHAAQKAVESEAHKNDHAVEHYDTTLTLAILIKDSLYYGHSGDSGIIALTTEGKYEQVTTQQRDEQGCVFPLFFTECWVFARYPKKVSTILLATDGMLETFFPIYIKNERENIHVSLAQHFMDSTKLQIKKLGREDVQSKIANDLLNIPDEQVNDDKTVVVVINTSVKAKKQPPAYYKEPDWTELKRKHDEAWKREAYPGLYKGTDNLSISEPVLTTEPEYKDEKISTDKLSKKHQNTTAGNRCVLKQKIDIIADVIVRAFRPTNKRRAFQLFLILFLVLMISLVTFLMIYIIGSYLQNTP
jgi:hypothetical protein